MPTGLPDSSRPLVSICIPAYRAEKHLAATLQSVAAQTFTDWEVIVTEDGSRDRTESMVRSFAVTVRQNVEYRRNDTNLGLPATRNAGISASTGTWVAFLDADDLWRPQHLEALFREARRIPCEMVFAGTQAFDDETGRNLSESVPTSEQLQNLPVALYTGELSILPSSVMIRRFCFDQFGGVSTQYPYVNDTEYWLRLLQKGARIAYSGSTTCLYRKHASSMSQRTAEMLVDSARLCEAYAEWTAIPPALKRRRPASLYRYAARTALPEEPKRAWRWMQRAVRLEPFNAKNLGLWAKAALELRRPSAWQRQPA